MDRELIAKYLEVRDMNVLCHLVGSDRQLKVKYRLLGSHYRKNELFKKWDTAAQMEIDDALKGFLKRIPSNLSQTQQFAIIYRALQSCIYDLKQADCRSFLTVLKTRTGVCLAYADLVTLLTQAAGIESHTVIGYINRKEKEFHAWNLVKLDGKWYHSDLTFDLKREIRHFLLSDEEMDARIWDTCYPECTTRFTGPVYNDEAVVTRLISYHKSLEKKLKGVQKNDVEMGNAGTAGRSGIWKPNTAEKYLGDHCA